MEGRSITRSASNGFNRRFEQIGLRTTAGSHISEQAATSSTCRVLRWWQIPEKHLRRRQALPFRCCLGPGRDRRKTPDLVTTTFDSLRLHFRCLHHRRWRSRRCCRSQLKRTASCKVLRPLCTRRSRGLLLDVVGCFGGRSPLLEALHEVVSLAAVIPGIESLCRLGLPLPQGRVLR